MSSSNTDEFKDEGLHKPIPSFDTSSLQLTTLAPALGVTTESTPDYLEYDTKGRSVVTKMFANAGLAYVLGTIGGGVYGFQEGLKVTPSHRWKIQLNSVLNHCSKHGSRIGNRMGVLSVFYSLYEGAADHFDIDEYSPITPIGPALAATLTGITYKAQAGPRVAALAGAIGCVGVGVTYGAYSVLGIPYGQKGWLFF